MFVVTADSGRAVLVDGLADKLVSSEGTAELLSFCGDLGDPPDSRDSSTGASSLSLVIANRSRLAPTCFDYFVDSMRRN